MAGSLPTLALALLLAATSAVSTRSAAEPAVQPRRPTLSVRQYGALLGGPTLVSLEAQAATRGEIEAAIGKLAGLPDLFRPPYGYASDREPMYAFKEHEAPFWQAIRDLGTATSSAYTPVTYSYRRTSLAPSTDAPGPMALNGVFGTELRTVRANVNREFHYNDTEAVPVIDNQTRDIAMYLLCDPKASVIAGSIRADSAVATDPDGQTYNLEFAHASAYDANPLMTPFTLRLPKGIGASRLSRVQGTLRVTVPVSKATWTDRIEKPDAEVKWNVQTSEGPLEISMKPTNARPGLDGGPMTYHIQLSYRGPLFGLPEPFSLSSNIAAIRFASAGGAYSRAYVEGGSWSTDSGDHSIGTAQVTVCVSDERGPRGLPLPISFSWALPTQAADVEVPFDFQDIPLTPEAAAATPAPAVKSTAATVKKAPPKKPAHRRKGR